MDSGADAIAIGPGDTLMRDVGRYALPLRRLVVRRDVDAIFDSRAQRIRELL